MDTQHNGSISMSLSPAEMSQVVKLIKEKKNTNSSTTSIRAYYVR